MRNDGWAEEGWRLVFVLLAGGLVGLLFGHALLFMLAALVLYTIRHIYNIQRLIHWLDDPLRRELPVHFGIWGDVYARILRRLNQHVERERRLNTELEQYQATAAALPDAVVSLGHNDEIRWVNKAARDLLGLRIPDDYRRPIANLFRTPGFKQFLSRRNFSETLELASPRGDKRRLSVRAVTYGRSSQILVIIQDVTARYRVEQVRRDFVANVSHELRTPLTVISGFVENMQADEGLCPKAWVRPLALISEQTARMQHIVEDLLLLARLEGGEKGLREETVDVAQMLTKIAEEARLLAREDVEISVVIESDWGLLGDASLLRSAITNLVVNAVHHTPAGGEVLLRWQDEPDASCIIVEDTGEGIAPEHIPRLTERFYRVDTGRSRERGGTGLGLAIVKHILQVHRGGLEIVSSVGEGSEFICRFPASLRCDRSAQALEIAPQVNDNSPNSNL